MTAVPLITLRAATLDDAGELLRWRNDATTRNFSFTSREVTPEEHSQWLAEKLSDDDCRLWIAQVDGRPAGQIRVERRGPGRAEVSIALAPERRGRGYAVRVIRAALGEVAREGFADEVVARIKPENKRSRSAFARAGFRPLGEHPGYLVLVAHITPSPT